MSTYIDAAHPDRHAPYLDIPNLVVDYLHYLDFVRQNSPQIGRASCRERV